MKERIGEMMKYALPLVNAFPRRERRLADILRNSMMEMYRLAVRLGQLDQFCKHILHIHHYVQYMDDIIILAPDKKVANRWKEEIRQFLTDRLRLDLNRKTAVRPAGRVEFVGYMVTSRSLRLRKQTIRRIKSAFRGICKKYFSGRMTREEFDRRAA